MDWEEKGINFIRVDDRVWHVTDLARARVADNRLDSKLKKYHIAILYIIINLGGIADADEIASETGLGAEKVAGALNRLNALGYVSEIASGRLLSDRDKKILYGEKVVSPAKELVLERQENSVAPSFVRNPEIPAKVNDRIEMAKTYGGQEV
jgi:hypothetical protein